ncbi:MAG: tRNA pseudouridine(38-40) synthase TruA [Saprospiraceae bacterium]
MPRIFLHLGYKGTAYHGWQTQAPPVVTVQQTLEQYLEKMLGYPVHVAGCGRTDTGVHARSYFAHVNLKAHIDYDGTFRLNRMLPDDIAIFDWIPVDNDAHAQRSATFRRYEYHIDLVKNPLHGDLAGRYDATPLDADLMQEVVSRFRQNSDFKAFCRSPEQYPSTICRIDECTLTKTNNGQSFVFTIQGNRFLHNMVRLLVARMIDVGKGSLSLEEIDAAFATGMPCKYETPAYAEGLFLVGVGYPFLEP